MDNFLTQDEGHMGRDGRVWGHGYTEYEHFVLYCMPIAFMAVTVFPEQNVPDGYFCKTTEGAGR